MAAQKTSSRKGFFSRSKIQSTIGKKSSLHKLTGTPMGQKIPPAKLLKLKGNKVAQLVYKLNKNK